MGPVADQDVLDRVRGAQLREVGLLRRGEELLEDRVELGDRRCSKIPPPRLLTRRSVGLPLNRGAARSPSRRAGT